MRIRPARPADAPGIARVHVDSWRTTYRGLLPDEFLASLSVESREAMWRRQAESAQRDAGSGFLLVVEDESRTVIGFASGGPERDGSSGFDGELYAIYLLEEHQGQGVGSSLFTEVVERFRGQGYRSMLVWVLEGNPSKAFYERLGGKRMGEKELEIAGAPFVEISYGWDDLGV